MFSRYILSPFQTMKVLYLFQIHSVFPSLALVGAMASITTGISFPVLGLRKNHALSGDLYIKLGASSSQQGQNLAGTVKRQSDE